MTRAFADTSFYQALLSPRDSWHQIAKNVFGELDGSIVTTEYILLELGSMMSRGQDRITFIEFVQNLRTDPDTTILPASNAIFEKGFALFASRQDKDWSLTDCISFVVMKEHDIQDALSTDKHFQQSGFNLLLEKKS